MMKKSQAKPQVRSKKAAAAAGKQSSASKSTAAVDGKPSAKHVLRMGMFGLGTVGGGVAELLERHGALIAQRAGVELKITRALVRETRRRRQGAASQVQVTSKADTIVNADDVDVVVELMGGTEPAFSLIKDALRAGKPVVTANKAVMALHGPEILRLAATHKTNVYFEAAVAGGIPIIRTLREGLAADRVTRLRGILNGTTNFILGLMEKGEPYERALSEAQRLGYAEADPTLDITGADAADKLAILIQLAFGTSVLPESIPTEGITALTPEVLADARAMGYCVKLLAIAKRVKQKSNAELLDVRVHPAFVRMDHHLGTVPGVQNAISVDSDALGTTLYQGPGAGGLATGTAVVADIIEAARNLRAGVVATIVSKGARADDPPKLLPSEQAVSAFYVRFLVKDEPGVLASIARILANGAISLATVLQHERGQGDEPVPLVIITHPTTHGAMEKALQKIKQLSVLHGGLSVIPIEETRRP